MAVEITLVRHAETEANSKKVWQGTSDSPLTGRGRDQAERFARRFTVTPDIVVSSDIGRAFATASQLTEPVVDPRWRELHLGSWEGLTQQEIASRDPDAFAALGSGSDIAFGGGERLSEMRSRLVEGFFDLANSLRDGGRAVVVSHGGALLTLIGALLEVDVTGKVVRLTNTSRTVVTVDDDGSVRLEVFNDAGHLAGAPVRAEEGATHVVLARHGETHANLEGRWQGHTHGELTDRGRAQARRLAGHLPDVEGIYTSPLARAADTAALLIDGKDLMPQVVDDLRELGFGNWEMKTPAEIAVLDPDAISALESGVDVVRGQTGETFADLEERVTRAIDRLAEQHPGRTIAAVSHGAATRAYVTRLLGIPFAERMRVSLLDNTAIGRVVYGSKGPALASWNLKPHLED